MLFFFVSVLLPPGSTRTDHLLPSTTRSRSGSLPAFRGDRFTHGRTPEDLLQGFNLPSQLASGELDPAAVAADWRDRLPARGVANGEVIDWLLWWDNALLPMLRTQLSHVRVLIAVRDPRDMLLDWIAFRDRKSPRPNSSH